jgi:hypothetical protein
MGRWTRLIAMTLTIFFGMAGSASATSYYMAANGSDSNNGTSEQTPWLHAPGMPNCTATCAAVTPKPGDSFIFRGGDTWHVGNSSSSPYIGVSGSTGWNFTWSGASGSCDFSNGVTSTCIYIGVDPTWYSGGSFTRPTITGDNPTSKSLVASCSHNEASGPQAIVLSGSYLIFDNFNIYGFCGATNDPQWMTISGTNNTMEDLYYHGWTEVNGDGGYMLNFAGSGYAYSAHQIWDNNVVDGSDSYCNGVNACSGYLGGAVWLYENSICRWIGGCIGSPNFFYIIRNSLFENVYQSYYGGVHGDVIHMYGGAGAPNGSSAYFYNNIIRNTQDGTTITLDAAPSGGTIYYFNNIAFNNCNTGLEAGGGTGDTASFYFVNNTYDGGGSCNVNAATSGPSGQTQNWTVYNNHMIGFGHSTMATLIQVQPGYGITANISDPQPASEIFQSEAAANGQGYTPSNNYQPTSTSVATYHTGYDLSSQCPTYSSDSALCSGSTGGVTNLAGGGAEPILTITPPPLRGGNWDAGAYQYSGSVATQPTAPTGLIASVQ